MVVTTLPLQPYNLDAELEEFKRDEKAFAAYHYFSADAVEFQSKVRRWAGQEQRLAAASQAILRGETLWQEILFGVRPEDSIADLKGTGSGGVQIHGHTQPYVRDLRGVAVVGADIDRQLNGIHYANFDYCQFGRCNFHPPPTDGRFPIFLFAGTSVRHTLFRDCTFSNVTFYKGQIEDAFFSNCSFNNVAFVSDDDASYRRIVFFNSCLRDVNLENTNPKSFCFLGDCTFEQIRFGDTTLKSFDPIGKEVVEQCRRWDRERFPYKKAVHNPSYATEGLAKHTSEIVAYQGLAKFYRALMSASSDRPEDYPRFVRATYLQTWLLDEAKVLYHGRCRAIAALFARNVLGYGYRPERPLIVWFLMNLVFSVAYLFGGLSHNGALVARSFHFNASKIPATLQDAAQCLYFSFVTATTVGFGDFSPASSASMALAATHAVLGILLMTMFTVVLARRFFK